MQLGSDLKTLIGTVLEQNRAKRDFVGNTRDAMRITHETVIEDGEQRNEQRFTLAGVEGGNWAATENMQRQIAAKLNIPWKHYQRLTQSHPDLIEAEVNALFQREPSRRMVRTLFGKARAFMSDRYRTLDNFEVLEATLPAIMNRPDLPTQVLGGNVSDDRMNLKVLFTGDDMGHEITRRTRTGEPRIIKPGFRLSNSETGNGSLKFEGFFYDGYCTNGCVFGKESVFTFSRNHIGGKLIEGTDFEIVSDDTRKKQDAAIVAEVRDGIQALANPEFVGQMVEQLRAAANTSQAANPTATVDMAIKELDLRDSERESILTTFLQDGDYSQFGLHAAVTQVANDPKLADYDRACELEDIGAQILAFNLRQWEGQYAVAA